MLSIELRERDRQDKIWNRWQKDKTINYWIGMKNKEWWYKQINMAKKKLISQFPSLYYWEQQKGKKARGPEKVCCIINNIKTGGIFGKDPITRKYQLSLFRYSERKLWKRKSFLCKKNKVLIIRKIILTYLMDWCQHLLNHL